MRPLSRIAVLVVAGAALTACGDSATPPTVAPVGRADVTTYADTSAIRADLNAIYPTGGVGTAANSQLSNVFKSWYAGHTKAARQEAAALCDFTQKQSSAGRLHAPTNSSATLANAVTSFCNEVYLSVNLAPGGVDVSSLDATAQFIPACTEAKVRVPSGHAIVGWPARNEANQCTYDQDVTVIITPIDYAAFPVHGGPNDTKFNQWPLYFDITTSPLVQPANPVTIGVCQLDDGSPYSPPEAIHPQLRLGHTRSAAAGGGFELLIATTPPFGATGLSCEPAVIGFNFRQEVRDGGLLGAGRGAVSFLASASLDLVTPKPAYAAHGGLGGLSSSFSPFGAVDPGYVPCSGETAVRSLSSATGVTYTFVNNGNGPVTAYWIDFNGIRESYGSIPASDSIAVNTFLTHPWVFVDAGGACHGSPQVFMPQSSGGRYAIEGTGPVIF